MAATKCAAQTLACLGHAAPSLRLSVRLRSAIGSSLSKRGALVRCQAKNGKQQQKGSSAKSASKGKGGSRSSGCGNGGGSGGGFAASAPQAQEVEEPHLTTPLQMMVVQELTGVDSMPAPLWSTFCGLGLGMWVGVVSAYCPATGNAEPVGLDGQRRELAQLWQCCVEEREVDGDTDRVLRHTARAATLEALQREMQQGGRQQYEPSCSTYANECWDMEAFHAQEAGLFIFDGGSYSRGPGIVGWLAAQQAAAAQVAAVPTFDETAAASSSSKPEQGAPPCTVQGQGEEAEVGKEGPTAAMLEYIQEVEEQAAANVDDWASFEVEHCMQYGGERRVRVRLTLDTAGGGDGTELDVDLLRVSVAHESWEGLPGSFCCSEQPLENAAQQELAAAARLAPSSMCGQWKVFEVSACMVEDISLETGLPAVLPVYEVQETRRQVLLPEPDMHAEGGTLWLPHSVAVELRAVPSEEEEEQGGPPGLQVCTWWQPAEGVVVTMTRRYAGDGRLATVSACSAVRDAPRD